MTTTLYVVVEEGQLVGERFRLVRLLASGGMGEVWVARHVDLDVDVALKFIDDDRADNEKTRRRFRREARAAAKLASPHIVRVQDYGVFEGHPYLVMELLEGEDLAARLQRGAASIEEATTIVSQVGAGLRLSHAASIVHRNLKPSNIFITTDPGTNADLVKVVDFGIAQEPRSADRAATTTEGMIIGSPAYMSPEQARGVGVDERADLWALALIAYELLTGERPFVGPPARMLGDILAGQYQRVHDHSPTLPKTLDAFFEKAFTPDIDERFSDVTSFVAAFCSAAGGNTAAVPAARSQPGDPSSTNAAPIAARDEETREQPAPSPSGSIASTKSKTTATGKARMWGAVAFLMLILVIRLWTLEMGSDDNSAADSSATVSSSEVTAPGSPDVSHRSSIVPHAPTTTPRATTHNHRSCSSTDTIQQAGDHDEARHSHNIRRDTHAA